MRRNAKIEVIDAAKVQAFRKDFLKIAKILEGVSTYSDLQSARKYASRWRESFENYLKRIRDVLGERETEHNRGWGTADPEWAKYYLRELPVVWALSGEVGDFPRVKDLSNFQEVSFDDKVKEMSQFWIEDGETQSRAYEKAQGYVYRNPPPTRLEVEAEAVLEWKKGARTWVQRIRSKARAAWKFLDELVEWAVSLRGGQKPLQVIIPDVEILSLEGFRVVFRGFDERSQFTDMEFLKEALRIYKRQASTRAPFLLRKQIPFIIEWTWEENSSRAAAYYTREGIYITPWALSGKNPEHLVKTLVHEMGHHIYKTYLSDTATKAWSTFIYGNYKKLDLRAALKELKAHGDNLEKVDPILALQLDTLLHDTSYLSHDLFSAKRIEDYLAQGNDPMVRVPVYPITGYANKNVEEAFCEALGLLVTFGPKTVLKPVRDMLRLILPQELRI